MQRGFVVSDLHLLTTRSDGDRHLDTLRSAAECADFFVLNGDIFDFQWSALPDHHASATAARECLESVVNDSPGCHFHVILGNHDCVPEYRTMLSEMAGRRSNLEWHESFLRLDRCIFLHGDVAIRTMNARGFSAHRDHWSRKRRRPGVLHPCYDLACRVPIASALQRLWFPRRCVTRRILSFLDSVAPWELASTEDIYFGHTHVPFTDYHYRGVRFHNTGSGVKGSRLHMCGVRLGDDRREH